MRRGSAFHGSLNRPQLIAGVPQAAFMLVGLSGSFCFVAQMYWALPAAGLVWALCRWLTKRDHAWVDLLSAYLKEEHIYDSTPRPAEVLKKRPPGWGAGLPMG